MYKSLDRCLCCGCRALVCYLDLRSQPAANSYTLPSPATIYGEPERESVFPLRVNVCRGCWHSQLSVSVEPELLYRNYLYVSGTTQTLKQHHRALAVDAVRRIQQHEADGLLVLDLGCNDGSLLRQFEELRCTAYGVDPAENLGETARAQGLQVATEYWTAFYARQHRTAKRYDLVTALNVVGHVRDPQDFLQGMKHVLAQRGLAVVEFPYGRHILEQGEWDQWYHEHHGEFLVHSFRKLAERAGLQITDIVETPVHGGSIRFYLRHAIGKAEPPIVAEYLAAEEAAGLTDYATYERFGRMAGDAKQRLQELLYQVEGWGCRMLGYGASAKLNTVLNALPTDRLQLDAIIDDNPLKHGCLTPGRGIPIRGPELLEEVPGSAAFLLGAWNFKAEIKQKLQALRPQVPGRVDYLITYVPEVRVEPLYP
jgi:SAM-dependent methyltransferase